MQSAECYDNGNDDDDGGGGGGDAAAADDDDDERAFWSCRVYNRVFNSMPSSKHLTDFFFDSWLCCVIYSHALPNLHKPIIHCIAA